MTLPPEMFGRWRLTPELVAQRRRELDALQDSVKSRQQWLPFDGPACRLCDDSGEVECEHCGGFGCTRCEGSGVQACACYGGPDDVDDDSED